MLDGLLSVIHEWVKRLNTDWTTAKAAFVDAAISSRAPASTALTNATWTDGKAAFLDVAVSSAVSPSDKVPIASGLISRAYSDINIFDTSCLAYSATKHTNTTTSYTDAVNYTGSGVLELLHHHCDYSATHTATIDLIIDGVTVFTGTTAASAGEWHCPIVGDIQYWNAAETAMYLTQGEGIPFKTSLQIRHKKAAGSGSPSSAVWYRYRKTG